MAELITKNYVVFAKKEVTEGTAETTAAGDAILCSGISLNMGRDNHVRDYQGDFGQLQPKIGAIMDSGISFAAELKGSGSTTAPEIDEILQVIFGTVSAGNGTTTVGGGSSTTSVVVTSSTNFTAGNMVMVETGSGTAVYETAFISAVPDGTHLTVSPALSFTPASGANVYEMRTYKLKRSGHASLTIDAYMSRGGGSSEFTQLVGARGNMKVSSPKAGSIPMAAFDFQAWNWVQSITGTMNTPTYDSQLPPSALASKFKIAGTLTNVFDVELDIGNELGKKISQNSTLGVYGTPVVGWKPTLKFKTFPDASIAAFTGWTANTQVTISQQWGNALYNTVAFYAPQAVRMSTKYGEDGGIGINEVDCALNISTTGEDALYFGVPPGV